MKLFTLTLVVLALFVGTFQTSAQGQIYAVSQEKVIAVVLGKEITSRDAYRLNDLIMGPLLEKYVKENKIKPTRDEADSFLKFMNDKLRQEQAELEKIEREMPYQFGPVDEATRRAREEHIFREQIRLKMLKRAKTDEERQQVEEQMKQFGPIPSFSTPPSILGPAAVGLPSPVQSDPRMAAQPISPGTGVAAQPVRVQPNQAVQGVPVTAARPMYRGTPVGGSVQSASPRRVQDVVPIGPARVRYLGSEPNYVPQFIAEVIGGPRSREIMPFIALGPQAEMMEEMMRAIAAQIINSWKIKKALYQQYGGRVIFQQAGHEPVDALRDFLREEEKKGSFRILDGQCREKFWEYYTNDKMHVFASGNAKELINTPWWLRKEE